MESSVLAVRQTMMRLVSKAGALVRGQPFQKEEDRSRGERPLAQGKQAE